MCEYHIDSTWAFTSREEISISFGQSNFFSLIYSKNWNRSGNFFPMNKLEKLPSVDHSSISSDLQQKIFSSLCLKSKRRMESNFSAINEEPSQVQSTSSVLFHLEARDDKSSEFQTSVLPQACEIAKELTAGNKEEMWKFVEELWVEILSCAGAQCRVDMHAQQLRKGPQFLSHVWLLQAHFGLLDQFQIAPRQASV
ncbi:hypothetical protein E2542_SST13172 [Spatholobus suberectus]|nr:hypothetical protein E2542_SST13172 [Spatholobus suberectus]